MDRAVHGLGATRTVVAADRPWPDQPAYDRRVPRGAVGAVNTGGSREDALRSGQRGPGGAGPSVVTLLITRTRHVPALTLEPVPGTAPLTRSQGNAARRELSVAIDAA